MCLYLCLYKITKGFYFVSFRCKIGKFVLQLRFTGVWSLKCFNRAYIVVVSCLQKSLSSFSIQALVPQLSIVFPFPFLATANTNFQVYWQSQMVFRPSTCVVLYTFWNCGQWSIWVSSTLVAFLLRWRHNSKSKYLTFSLYQFSFVSVEISSQLSCTKVTISFLWTSNRWCHLDREWQAVGEAPAIEVALTLGGCSGGILWPLCLTQSPEVWTEIHQLESREFGDSLIF